MLGAGYVDPASIFSLRRLGEKKKTRELVTMSGKMVPFSVNMNTSQTQGTLPVNFSRYGESSLRLSSESLPPGEYALVRLGGQSAFCFGID
jgi:hypothetical protein